MTAESGTTVRQVAETTGMAKGNEHIACTAWIAAYSLGGAWGEVANRRTAQARLIRIKPAAAAIHGDDSRVQDSQKNTRA